MDRLTQRDISGIPFCQNAGYLDMLQRLAAYEDTGLEPEECKTFYNIISKLSGELVKYKETEKEGRLIILPCEVGDTVYVHTEKINSFLEAHKFVEEKKVVAIRVESDGLWIVVDDYDSYASYHIRSKRLYFTREAAEVALESSL